MINLLPFLVLLLVAGIAAYHRWRLPTWAAVSAIALAVVVFGTQVHWLAGLVAVVLFAVVAVPLLHLPTRRQFLTLPVLKLYQRMLPSLSETEQVALEAGTVGFEGELFTGRPDWSVLLQQPAPRLTADEQAFIDGPVEELCAMIDEWRINHELADLPPAMWEFIKKHRFFGMIIPKDFGGLGFSAYAHHRVLVKIASMSGTVASTVCVPNSLGPAELLLHYGTDAQKQHYLPRLARGEDIPCFGLTSPTAGSDATSISDHGIVEKRMVDGREVLGVRLTFDKRYITLAPVATVIGLAFRLYDPDRLIGETEDVGITLALLPRDTPGIEIGRRHFPLNVPFQNGPIHGKDVFVPIDTLIGGPAYAGQGWRMLVECLSVGRSISLPSNATGGVKMAALATTAYARIRKQFNMAIGHFEGIQEALSRILGNAYAIGALARSTAAAVDRGEKPSVPSAIAKYHTTELGREVIKDAMDIHGGKGVILGPKNYLGRAWMGAPISITVEGANIMTRSLMIFGQGAIRCHPLVLKEMQALAEPDPGRRLALFDGLLFAHVGLAVSNAVRAFWLGLIHARVGRSPAHRDTAKYFRKLDRYAAALGLTADIAMLALGGKLKMKERLSARLGDVLSELYIASAVLKQYEDQGRPEADKLLLAWTMHDRIHRMQVALAGFIDNFPVRWLAWFMAFLVFPIGRRERAPSDRLGRRLCTQLLAPSETRDRLAEGVYRTASANNEVGRMDAILPLVIQAEPVERKFVKALRGGAIKALDPAGQLAEAVAAGVLSEAEAELLARAREAAMAFIHVDDFDAADLRAGKGAREDRPPLRTVA
ncbi:MAG: acyl-CoA dehydrogenase [Xanthomonadales bacterium]|nr:acyl-CoA dehydrogenase [Xanthomonadales bacterium]